MVARGWKKENYNTVEASLLKRGKKEAVCEIRNARFGSCSRYDFFRVKMGVCQESYQNGLRSNGEFTFQCKKYKRDSLLEFFISLNLLKTCSIMKLVSQ